MTLVYVGIITIYNIYSFYLHLPSSSPPPASCPNATQKTFFIIPPTRQLRYPSGPVTQPTLPYSPPIRAQTIFSNSPTHHNIHKVPGPTSRLLLAPGVIGVT